jgi:cytochrome c peroxidase
LQRIFRSCFQKKKEVIIHELRGSNRLLLWKSNLISEGVIAMKEKIFSTAITLLCMTAFACAAFSTAHAADKKATSYSPVDITKPFADTMAKMKADKAAVMKKHEDLLQERYDLKNAPAQGVTMTRGKAVQDGVRAKLPQGMTWEKLAAMSPAEIKEKGLFPKGFLPLPHPDHPEGGMVFPKFHIDEIKKQTGRALTLTLTCPIISWLNFRPPYS